MISDFKAEIIPFDLKNIYLLSDQQIHALNKIYRTFSELASVKMSELLNAEVTVEFNQCEQLPFSIFLASQTVQSCYATFDMQPLLLEGLITVNAELSSAIIDILLGGEGFPSPYLRNFNSFEIAINRKFINQLLKCLSEAWKPLQEITFTIDDINFDPRKSTPMASYLKCMVAVFHVHFLQSSGRFFFVLPSKSLETIADHLETLGADQPPPSSMDLNLDNFEVELTAILGGLLISQHDINHLQIGDILRLDQLITEPIAVCMDGQYCFPANPGFVEKHRGIILTNYPIQE
jgi:flagellar motor switch protein FliM